MKKHYKTFIHESAKELEFMIFSAGKIGHQIKTSPDNLLRATRGNFEYIIK